MKANILITMAFFTLLFTGTAIAGVITETIGGDENQDHWNNYVVAFNYTPNVTGDLISIGAQFAGASTNTFRVAVYDDNAGKPNNLLVESAATAVTATWTDINMTGVRFNNGSTYWIGYQQSSTSPNLMVVVRGQCWYYSYGYSTFPANYSASPTTCTEAGNFRIVLNETIAPAEQWWSSNWTNRQNITFNASLSGYTILDLTVPYNSNMSANYSDIRFVDDSTNTTLPYCIKTKTNSNTANIFVNVSGTTINANKTIGMYYHNSLASPAEQCENVFFFIHSNMHNSTFYQDSGTLTVNANSMEVATTGLTTANLTHTKSIGMNMRIEVGWMGSSSTGGSCDWGINNCSLGANGCNGLSYEGAGYWGSADGANGNLYLGRDDPGPTVPSLIIVGWTRDTDWHNTTVTRNSTGGFTMFLDGTYKGSVTDTTYADISDYFTLGEGRTGTATFNNISIRQFGDRADYYNFGAVESKGGGAAYITVSFNFNTVNFGTLSVNTSDNPAGFTNTSYLISNISYPYRFQILENTTTAWAVPINQTNNIDGQAVVWAYTANDSYLYCTDTNCTQYTIADSNGVVKNWHTDTNNLGYNQTGVLAPNNECVFAYHMNGTSNTPLSMNDVCGNNYTLTDATTTGWTWTPNGKIGKGFTWTSAGSQTFQGASGMSFLNVSNYTLEAWVNVTNGGQHYQYIGGVAQNNGGGGIFMRYKYWDNVEKVTCDHFDSTWGHTNSPLITGNQWYHIACVFDGTTLKMYVNGSLVDSVGRLAVLNSGINYAFIGKAPADSGDSSINGQIDEFKFYNRSMSASEIQLEYYAGIGNLTSLGASGEPLTGAYNVTIDTNVNYTVNASGTNFTSNIGTIPIGNLKIGVNEAATNLISGSATALSTISQQIQTFASTITTNFFGWWLSIPAAQPAGSYQSNVTITYSNV